MDKPNMVFVVTDDQRFDTVAALGNPLIHTPNFDRLVRMGVAFTNAHIPGGTSGAVCMPSRAMIHSGRSLFHLDGVGETIPPCHATLGEAFRNNGYRTIGIGKWHNSPPAFARSFSDGGSIFFGGMWDHWNVPTSRYDPAGDYDNVINFVVNFFEGNKIDKVHCDEFVPGKHSSELLTDTAIDFLKKQEGDEPFLLYLAYLAPHDPRTMPERFREMYHAEDIPLPENFSPTQLVEHFPMFYFRDEKLAAYPRREEEVREQIADYYAMISHLDHEFGRLLDALEEQGRLKDTIVVFTGDNGLAVGQHGFMGKEDLYEHSIRVPLIVAGAGVPQNRRCDAFVYLYDIFPTLCEAAGIPVPETVDGRSFLDCVHHPEKGHREELYLAFTEQVRGIKTARYKLLEYAVTGRTTQLFDLKEDPMETRDLAGDPAYAPVIDELRGALFRLRDEWEDRKHPSGRWFWESYEALS